MRKYFLLGVALLVANNAFATTDYAEVTAKATIQIANKIECTGDLDFGTIVMKANNSASTVSIDISEYHSTGDVLSVVDINSPDCIFGDDGVNYVNIEESDLPTSVTLTGEQSGKTVSVTDFEIYDGTGLNATLNIPANVTADTYVGTFTLAVAYE
ncbi:MAG: DUF4402 domain-containing protein [Alphaproteobacteria bacterium]|nr:DUF4402 domain-containing protein [Alphaproteobacteria bacterium]